ncbi:uncharacterized protein LOC118648751 [Monomorium pharaonis]|uniref:uncharacterized protein LOC118648751 n=1 Tax=Monomorium pharaonis TaxID=307658 RepID=UPI001746CB93|nr:uncharacterized protein LOC118648751 [Monomorium pharaonis]
MCEPLEKKDKRSFQEAWLSDTQYKFWIRKVPLNDDLYHCTYSIIVRLGIILVLLFDFNIGLSFPKVRKESYSTPKKNLLLRTTKEHSANSLITVGLELILLFDFNTVRSYEGNYIILQRKIYFSGPHTKTTPDSLITVGLKILILLFDFNTVRSYEGNYIILQRKIYFSGPHTKTTPDSLITVGLKILILLFDFNTVRSYEGNHIIPQRKIYFSGPHTKTTPGKYNVIFMYIVLVNLQE